MKRNIIYLDHAAATPMDDKVTVAMEPYFADQFYNPSATYSEALAVRKSLDVARSKVAHWLGAKNSEIIFTSGGTEANNLAIQGIMNQHPDGNIVISSIEHESIIAPAERYNAKTVAVDQTGRINLDDLAKKIDEKTVLVSIMYANNEIGTIQQIREVAKIIDEIKRQRKSDYPLYFHTDACQAANYLDLHVSRLGVDMMTLNGGKIYGPKQSGCLYVKASTKLSPIIQGGGQERGLRSGTENVAGCVGFSTALDVAQIDRQLESGRLNKLQTDFISSLQQAIPSLVINGSTKYRLSNNIHITIAGTDNERILIQLDSAGILAAAGSACSASNEQPSHVLAAIGVSQADAQASLRLTMGRQTTQDSIEKTVSTLKQLVNS